MPNAQQALEAARRLGMLASDSDDAVMLANFLWERSLEDAAGQQASSERFGAAMNESEPGWPRGGGIGSTGEVPGYATFRAKDVEQRPATDTPDLEYLPTIETDAETRTWCVNHDLPLGQDAFAGVVKFQSGPVREAGVNGTSMEAVLRIVLDRLQGYQRGPFPCDENQQALAHFRAGLEQLELRTLRRRQQGVEGRNLQHRSA